MALRSRFRQSGPSVSARHGRVVPVFAGAVSLILIALVTPGRSQIPAAEPPPADACDTEPRLPMVPFKDSRPTEGPAPDQKWRTARDGADQAPVASFIDTLRKNDAAIEVIIGQGRLLTVKPELVSKQRMGVIAVGDPTIVEFQVMPDPRMIRLIGGRAGVTDLSITTADGQTVSFEIRVVYDLEFLRAQLKELFPDAHLRLGQIREHLVVEGQARSPVQVSQILTTIEGYLESMAVPQGGRGQQSAAAPGIPSGASAPSSGQGASRPSANGKAGPTAGQNAPNNGPYDEEPETPGPTPGETVSVTGGGSGAQGAPAKPRVINLIRVPGVHQVMLQVRVAELNRTALRQIGGDFLKVNPASGNIIGTAIGGASVNALATLGLGGLTGAATGAKSNSTTAFGVFPSGDFELLIRALRSNSLLSILAEPNLMAMSGMQASFLAGGEIPVPVPQSGGGTAGGTFFTIEWKQFGVQLNFIPYVQEDDLIRLRVEPEVSSIDEALGVDIQGTRVPGINTRRGSTTVELREGETLAIAGLLQVELNASTSRVPLLGDLPYIGPLFSNTSHERVEKELLVLVTPTLVVPMKADQVPPVPGENLQDPNDLEFYLLNRIEGRTGRNFDSTMSWQDPFNFVRLMRLEQRCVHGPVGLSE